MKSTKLHTLIKTPNIKRTGAIHRVSYLPLSFMLIWITLMATMMFLPASASQAQDIGRRAVERADTIRTLDLQRALRVNDSEIRAALARPEVRAELSKGAPGLRLDVDSLMAHEIRPQSIIGAGNDGEQHDVEPSETLLQPLDQAHVREVLGAEDGITVNRNKVIDGIRTRVRGKRRGRVRIVDDDQPQIKPLQPAKPNLDVATFAAGMHEALKDRVASYMWQLRQNGQTIATGAWDWARRPQDGGLGWEAQNRSMHVASVSKLVTAIALVKLLQEKNISYNTPIVNYLPAYWSIGPNVSQITFRHLLTHRSGIRVPGSATDYWTMRQEIAAGVNAAYVGAVNPPYDPYENTNYGLMRILIPIINGSVEQNALQATAPGMGSQPTWHDQWWDHVTVSRYRSYVWDNVFEPSFTLGKMIHSINDALAYSFPPSGGHGWNSGNLRSVSGGAGWIMSVDGVLDVMGEFRRGGIVPPATAQQALDSYFGIDQIFNTPAGKIYNKNGSWGNGAGQVEQCVAYFLPDNMELVVFVNSPIGTENYSLRNLVRQLYVANLK